MKRIVILLLAALLCACCTRAPERQDREPLARSHQAQPSVLGRTELPLLDDIVEESIVIAYLGNDGGAKAQKGHTIRLTAVGEKRFLVRHYDENAREVWDSPWHYTIVEGTAYPKVLRFNGKSRWLDHGDAAGGHLHDVTLQLEMEKGKLQFSGGAAESKIGGKSYHEGVWHGPNSQ